MAGQKGSIAMMQFKGFKTKEEAKDFAKHNGGMICWEERTPKRKQLTERGKDYMFAVQLGGLDKQKYPYCVQWRA